jgi:hypothetical protein
VKNSTPVSAIVRAVLLASGMACAATSTSAQESVSGAPFVRETGRAPMQFPSVVDDAFGQDSGMPNGPVALPDTMTQPVQRGEGFGPLDQLAQVEINLADHATQEHRAWADEVVTAWATGEFARGRELLNQLSDAGVLQETGFSWLETGAKSFPIFNTDRRIGAPRTDAVDLKLDFDTATGNLYALVSWPDGWSLNRSTNGGNSWTETYFWSYSQGPTDADLAVVDGFIYVGYTASDIPTAARFRRFSASTGLSDGGYGFFSAITAPAGQTFREIAVESNTDSLDNRIYMAALQSNNQLQFVFDDPFDGTTFVAEPTGVANATSSLDLHWNHLYEDYFIYMSYKSTSNQIQVLRNLQFSGWQPPTTVASFAPVTPPRDVAISAYDDTVIVAYENDSDNLYYGISYNGGDTYGFGTLGSAGNYSNADATARLGYGTAAITTFEAGEPDDVQFYRRPTYAPGSWPNFHNFNSFDVQTGNSPVAIQALPAPVGASSRHGMIYRGTDDNAYFDAIIGSCTGDIADDFGTPGPDGQVSFGDFLALLGLIGPCPSNNPGGCPGDIADDFGTLGGDGRVSFGDFLALLGRIGPC